MLLELLERFFPRSPNSRQQVKNRLRLVLAHDRTDLPPHVFESMRQEILEVVSRYVDLDRENMEFSLETSEGATALIANLPIRRVKLVDPQPSPTAKAEAPTAPPAEPTAPELPLASETADEAVPTMPDSPPQAPIPTDLDASPEANSPPIEASPPAGTDLASSDGTGSADQASSPAADSAKAD
jgi:cell division topological specificity factor